MTTDALLFWEHGTLLQPQHFQLLTSACAAESSLVRSLTGPWPWGIRTLRLDEEGLKSGQISVQALDVVFADGTHAVLGKNAVLVPRNCTRHWTSPDKPLTLFVGLPSLRTDQANVTELASLTGTAALQAGTRYVAPEAPESRPDMLAGGAEADVRFMYLNLRLLFSTEEEELGRCQALPLARLVHTGDTIELDKSFVPPCLDIQAHPVLAETLLKIRNAVCGRLSQLEDFKLSARETQGRSGQAPITVQTLALHSMLQVLARQAPLLEHLCEAGHLHPWQVYGVLRQLVGELSLFDADISVFGEQRDASGSTKALPPYSHGNPGPCFTAAADLIARLVDRLAAGPAHVLSLERQGIFWTADLPEHARSGYDFWLQIRSADTAFLESLATSGLRFASSDTLSDLLARSLPGIPMLREDPPQGLPRREDTLYLILDVAHPLWQRIQQTGKAALFLPTAPQDCRVHLVLMSPILRPGQ